MKNRTQDERTGFSNIFFRLVKWLISSRKRLLIVVIILIIVILLFITWGSFKVYKNIKDSRLEEDFLNDTKQEREKLVENLDYYYHIWHSQNIDDYEFTIEIIRGGAQWWEGLHGGSSGCESITSLHITVENGDAIAVINSETGNTVSLPEYNNCNSISELFLFTFEVLNNINQGDLALKAGTYQESDFYLPKENFYYDQKRMCTPIIYAEFNEIYGYPSVISIYVHCGNLELFRKNYLIEYVVTNLEPL